MLLVVLLIVTVLAGLFMVGCLLERPCQHTDVVRLDDRESVCCLCDELLLTEDVER